MKAKVIETGEVVEVYHEPEHGQITNVYKESVFVNGRIWMENELEFIPNNTKKKSYVKIDRNVLFEICDAILNHDGYADRNYCPKSDLPVFWDEWDNEFRKKVENIRYNS